MARMIYYSVAHKLGSGSFLGGMFMESMHYEIATPKQQKEIVYATFAKKFRAKETPLIVARNELLYNQTVEFDITPHLGVPYSAKEITALGFKDSNIEFDKLFGWIDPDHFKDETVKNERLYIAVKNLAWHLTGMKKPIHSKGLEKIDDHEWELFHAYKHVEREGKARIYYGMFVEGIGAFDVMVEEENMRDLTDEEKTAFSGKVYGMYGSHSGKLSYTTSLPTIE